MKFFALFIYRPVATILISLAITLCGVLGFRLLPVAPLPQVDYPGDYDQRLAARCLTGDDGLLRGNAAGALAWPHRRGQRNDLDEFAWQHAHHFAVRF